MKQAKPKPAEAQLQYQGYAGTVEVSLEDACLHGRLLHIDDLITYEGDNVADITAAFRAAVYRYLAHCKAMNKQPNRPYSGSFNVRIGPDRHRQLARMVGAGAGSINEALCLVLDSHFQQRYTVVHSAGVGGLITSSTAAPATGSSTTGQSHGFTKYAH